MEKENLTSILVSFDYQNDDPTYQFEIWKYCFPELQHLKTRSELTDEEKNAEVLVGFYINENEHYYTTDIMYAIKIMASSEFVENLGIIR